jgi:hypothetical protein
MHFRAKLLLATFLAKSALWHMKCLSPSLIGAVQCRIVQCSTVQCSGLPQKGHIALLPPSPVTRHLHSRRGEVTRCAPDNFSPLIETYILLPVLLLLHQKSPHTYLYQLVNTNGLAGHNFSSHYGLAF